MAALGASNASCGVLVPRAIFTARGIKHNMRCWRGMASLTHRASQNKRRAARRNQRDGM
jgi:hypothetical protein